MNIRTKLANFNPYNKTTFLLVCGFAPFYFGLISYMLGADTNWDLANYHIYNPYALLNHKLLTDLAPASIQSYFNPLLDVPYYLMTVYFPAPLAGFIMGTVHGVNFSLVAGIAYKALPGLPSEDRFRIPLLLALFGCTTANFLSSVGNTMGDSTTSLFVLTSLLIVMSNWERITLLRQGSTTAIIIAGVVVGMGAGLKLTNIVYASALCLSFFAIQINWLSRLRLSFLFGVGVLVGLFLTGGFWFCTMWNTFGNPLFPQFARYFPNSLIKTGTIYDVSWRPKSVMEALEWPFLFSFNPYRVGELYNRQIVWAVAYLIFWCWAFSALLSRWAKKIQTRLTAPEQFIVMAIAIGYGLWMLLFSIQRYLVPIEVLVPLFLYILITKLLSYSYARTLAVTILSAIALFMMHSGLETWGHTGWSEKMFTVKLPAMEVPDKTTVFLVSGSERGLGWIAAQFPNTVAFVSAGNSFTQIVDPTVHAKKIHDIVDNRKGPIFAILPPRNPTSPTQVLAAKELSKYGYSIIFDSCVLTSALIGAENYPYLWCAVTNQ